MMTQLADVQNQVQKVWATMLIDELLESSLLAQLVNKEYEGEINKQGDTVKVSQINRPTAVRRTTGANEDTFEATKLSTTQVELVCNQTITAAFEFGSLVEIQSQIGAADSTIRLALVQACEIAVNNYLYSIIAPSASTPAHKLNGITDFNAAALLNVRKLASQAKWPVGERWLLVDPSYQNDLFTAATLTSQDYVDDMPTMEGRMVRKRFGFNILEDNSDGMAQLSPTLATSDLALGLIPSAVLAAIGNPEFKVSDLHAQKRHGFLISASLIMGAKMGIDGALKCVSTYNT